MKTPTFEAGGSHRRLTYRPENPESSRVYLFPGGDRIEIENVIEGRVSSHGNHQLLTADGAVHVIPWGWICLTFPAESRVTPDEVIERGEPSWEEPPEPGEGEAEDEPDADAAAEADQTDFRDRALADVSEERDYQVEKWGADFDDRSWSHDDWLKFIDEYGHGRGRAVYYDFRKRMVKVAALAVAAIEASDRVAKGV